MPHWLQIVAAVAGGLGAVATAWRTVFRPLRAAYRDLIQLLKQIRDASGGVQRLAEELRKLAGGFVTYAVYNANRLDEHEQQIAEVLGRIGDLGQVLAELDTDIGRLKKEIRGAAKQPES